MKKSNKKSTVKSKSKKVKNPLKKYQVGGPPISLGSTSSPGAYTNPTFDVGTSPGLNNLTNTDLTSYSGGYDTISGSNPFSSDHLQNVADPSYTGNDLSLNINTATDTPLIDYNASGQAKADASNKAAILKSEYKTTALSKQDANLRKAKGIAESVAAVPFANIIGEAVRPTKVDDPNKFYSRGVREKLESYNKKIKGAKTTSASLSSVASGLGAAAGTAALVPGVGWVVSAGLGLGALAAGIGAGISSGAAGGYSNKQEQFATEYKEKVEDRKRDILRTDEQRKMQQ